MAQTMFGGFDPALVQQTIEQEQQKSLMAQANMDPAAYLRYSAGLQGQRLGQGVAELFGISQQDPRLKQARDAQEAYSMALSEVGNSTSSEFFQKFADLAAKKNLPTLAQQAAQQATTLAKSELDIRKSALSQVQEDKLRRELADLGPNATEDQVLSVVTKYGSPDKIMAALSAKQSREATRLQQREFQEQRLDLARMNFNFRMDLANQKNADKAEAKENKLNAALGVADNVISVADKASKQVSGFTAGMLGKPLASIGVPDAVDLEENLKTIQANLGFKELQAMRDASPTGGALGQVALKELEFLQAALTSLSNRQSPTQLKENLDKVVKHYTAWRSAVMQARQETQSSGGGAAPAPGQSVSPTVSPASIPPGVVVKKKGD